MPRYGLDWRHSAESSILSRVGGIEQKNMSKQHDWENQHVLSRNREPAHATLIPFADEETALAGERSASPFFKLLNGQWRFFYAPSPAAIPPGFEAPGFAADTWNT